MRSFAIIFCALFVLFSFPLTQAKIIHVPGDSSTIQGGINGAVDGDTVLVAPGTYYENINFYGKVILVTSDSGPENTIISKAFDNISIVTFSSGEDSNSVIEGFTITGGYLASGQGGGIRCVWSSPRIVRNIIHDNEAVNGGGGVYFSQCPSPLLIDNIISENIGAHGGGVRTSGSSARIERNLFVRNQADRGGALFCDGASWPVVKNNTIHGNHAFDLGGGIGVGYHATPQIVNNIISGTPRGYGFACIEEAWPTIIYNDFWDNELLDFGGWWGCGPGDGCLFEDPLYCDPNNDYYQLYNTSPCLGAGQYGADIGAFGLGCLTGYGVRLSRGDDPVGLPQSLVFAVFSVQNIGIFSDTYSLEAGDSLGWSIDPTYSELTLDPGQASLCSLTVAVPTVTTFTANKVTMTASSQTDQTVKGLASLKVNVIPLCGDVNWNGIVDIGDIVYTINYLFRGGPPPCEP